MISCQGTGHSGLPDDEDFFSRNYLGFDAEWLGGSGQTDVYIIANQGHRTYSVTCDCKTTQNTTIADRQIDWATLKEHRENVDADYSLLVRIDFQSRVFERAQQYKVGLLRTEELINILEMHAACPFTLEELRKIFLPPNERPDGWMDELTVINEENIRNLTLISKVLRAISQIQGQFQQLDSVQTRDIFWNIQGQEATRDTRLEEVKKAVEVLTNPLLGLIVADDQNNLRFPMTLATAVRRLEVLLETTRGSSI